MDRINGLPDELLVKILSFVPTKVAVSSSILSKRWKFLWLWLPKLDYDLSYGYRKRTRRLIRDFIDKNLPLHRAPVLESLCLEVDSGIIELEDFKKWVDIALSRCVRELDIMYCRFDKSLFPSGFYTCKSLVSLKLNFVVLIDVPSMVCLPSLKTLKLERTLYKDNETLQPFLSACPVLEDLSVILVEDENMTTFTINVPSLQKLELFLPNGGFDGYEIDTPSLKYLKLVDMIELEHDFSIKDMPMLREAYIDFRVGDLKSVIGSVTSVKRLTICAEDEAYASGIVFNKLEHLTLCLCKEHSSNLLGKLLKDSPYLRVLDVSALVEVSFSWSHDHGQEERNDMVPWNQPSDVPECLLSSLQMVKWSQYFGRPQDRDALVYILKNARHLKRAIFRDKPLRVAMIKELTTWELEFVEGKDIREW